jgi:hypothetical protein
VEQILVMKSKRKDVLVKNVGGGPTLFQSPGKSTPSFMDLARAGFQGQGTSGNPVGMGGRLAGLAGMAGKGLAGLQTVNQVAQQAQGGNPLGAVLGAGYAFEANDPTGKRTANAIQGQAPPTPSVEEQRANVPTVPLPNVTENVALPNQSTQAPAPQAPAPQVPAPQAPAPQAPAPMHQMGSDGIPVAVSPPMAEQMRQRQNQMKAQGRGPPVAVGPQPNNIGSAERAFNESQNYVSPYQPQQTTPAPVAPAPTGNPNDITDPMYQGQNFQVQNQNVAKDPFTHNLLQQQAQEQLMGTDNNNNNIQNAEFFASTLMEKLGADTVYKMNPHQVAMVSAYTFLKLS